MGARLSPPRLHSRTAGPHNRDNGHRVEQLWNVHGQTNSLDHGLASAPRREVNLLVLETGTSTTLSATGEYLWSDELSGP